MVQRLRMPIDDFKATAGYKNPAYLKRFKFNHFGMDGVSVSKSLALYGLGNGIVKAAGLDGVNGKTRGAGSGCGYVLVVVYDNCINNKTGETGGITATYMHLREMPKVKKNDKVTKDTLLGFYGDTGENVTGAHLHIQFDTDTKYPLYCTGLASKGHALLKSGTVDSTVNPCDWLWRDEEQTVSAPASVYYANSEFLNIPKMPEIAKKIIKKANIIGKNNLHTKE
jgi:murein DD-endopeptidase MepM/ murein hydrolase activator NlpD